MSGTASRAKVSIGKLDISYESIVVERDIGQADAAQVAFSYSEDLKFEMADPVAIEFDNKPIFIGEVVNIATTYQNGGFRIQVSAMNRLHRLNRGRRSDVFANLTEQDIIKKVLEDSKADIGLADWPKNNPNFGSKTPKETVVHWSNQTPIEFLAMRAARYGCHVWCVDKLVYWTVPDLSTESKFALVAGQTPVASKKKKQLPLKTFWARKSSSEIVKQVTVRCSDPASGACFIAQCPPAGQASPKSKLGGEHAIAACKDHGNSETATIDLPAFSKDEAQKIADGEFLRRSLTFMTGKAVVECDPELQLGIVVEVAASEHADDPLNGNYYVMGMTHNFAVKDKAHTSYDTELRLARDAQKRPA